MTTVAYRAGVMACDSCWSYGGTVDSLQSKIMRLKGGGLLGQSGANDARDVVKILASVRTPEQMPTTAELLGIRADFMGLLVLPSGHIYKVATTFVSPDNWTEDFNPEDLGVWKISRPYAAVGSGGDLAMMAMRCGMPAKTAVERACEFDLNSRPPVHTLELIAPKKKRGR